MCISDIPFKTTHRDSSNVSLDGLKDGPSDGLWQLNRCEETRRVEIVLTRLIHYSDLAVLLSVHIGQYSVEFSWL